jgi:hypothetical protein
MKVGEKQEPLMKFSFESRRIKRQANLAAESLRLKRTQKVADNVSRAED